MAYVRNSAIVKSNLTRKEFVFPGTKLKMDVCIYRNLDGTFRNAETILFAVRDVYDKVHDYLRSLFQMGENKRYHFKVPTHLSGWITEISCVNGVWQMEDEKVVRTLTSEELMRIKDLIILGVGDFIEMFGGYHALTYKTSIGDDLVSLYREMGIILTASVGAKIKFLDDILSLYIALNGQTYFDVIGHIIMSEGYTIPAILSTTGLYFAHHQKLRGNDLLKNAKRRAIKVDGSRLIKRQILTENGLIFFHARQFRILPERKGNLLQMDDMFEPLETELIEIVEEKSGNGDTLGVFVSKSAEVLVYNKTLDIRVLKFGGRDVQGKVLNDLHMVLRNESGQLSKIDCNKPRALLDVLEILDLPKCKPLLEPLMEMLNIQKKNDILKKLVNVDIFGTGDNYNILNKHVMTFLGLVEPNPVDVTDYLLSKLFASTDPWGILQDYVEELIKCLR